MPWGLSSLYNALPNLGISSALSNMYQGAPDLGISSTLSDLMNPYGPRASYDLNYSNPAVQAAEPQLPAITQAPEQGSMLSNAVSGFGDMLGNAMSAWGDGGYGPRPSSGLTYDNPPEITNQGSALSNALGLASSAASGLGSLASQGASGLGRMAGRAVSGSIGYIPDNTRNQIFENAGARLGSGIGRSVQQLPFMQRLPFGIADKFNNYATHFGRQLGNHLSNQFSQNPQSSFGGFRNLGATLGGGAGGTLLGTSLGSMGGSALGGYLGSKLGKYGAPIGKVLGGLLGGGLGAVGGGLGGGYLGNRATRFKRGGRVKTLKRPRVRYNRGNSQG